MPSPSRAALRAALLSLLLCPTLPSCGDEGAASAPDPSGARGDGVRLLDHISEVTLSPPSSRELFVTREGGGMVLYDRAPLGPGAGPDAAIHGSRILAMMLAEPPDVDSVDHAVAVVSVRATSRWTLVQVDTGTPLGPGEGLRVVSTPGAADVRDPDSAAQFLRERRSQLMPIEPIVEDPIRHEVVLEERKAGGSVVVCLYGGRAFLGRCRVRVVGLDQRTAWLRRNAPLANSALARHVQHAESSREALVMAPGTKATFRMRVPKREPRLTCAVAAPVPVHGAEVCVTARRGGESLVAAVALRKPGAAAIWRRLVLDLTEFAGSDIELEFAASGEGSDGLFAIANPWVRDRTSGSSSDAEVPPDIVLISLDTVRADRLSLYGAARETTPQLDDLARSAVVFDSAIAPAAWTLPAHVSMMTGLHPDRHGATTDTRRIPRGVRLLAERLREVGYETIAVTGGGFVSPDFGFARGFERYDCIDPAFPPAEFARATDMTARIRRSARAAIESRRHLLDEISDAGTTPRFFFVHTYAAHNYTATSKSLRSLVGAHAERGDDEHMIPEGAAIGATFPEQLRRELRELPDETTRESRLEYARWLYDGSVREADTLVGDVVDALARAGRLERSLVVVTSDHGEMIGEHGEFGHKNTLHEPIVRVPLVVRGPGMGSGRIGDVVSIVDIAPTILDFLGLPSDAGGVPADGRSLVPMLRGNPQEPQPALAHNLSGGREQHMLRGSRLKLMRTSDGDEIVEEALFDLAADPSEQVDVSAERAMDVERLGRGLELRVSALRELGVAGDEATLSAELREKLRQLGYLGD